MKIIALATVLVVGFSSAKAAENWFVVVTSSLGQYTVTEVYGWDDNQKPCTSIASAMNIMIKQDYNPLDKNFTCVPQNVADKLDKDNPLSMRVVK